MAVLPRIPQTPGVWLHSGDKDHLHSLRSVFFFLPTGVYVMEVIQRVTVSELCELGDN